MNSVLLAKSQGNRGTGAAGCGQISPGMDRNLAEVNATLHLFLLTREYRHMGQRIYDEVVRLHDQEGLSCLEIVPIIDALVMRESPMTKVEWEEKERARQRMISDPVMRATLRPRDQAEVKLFEKLSESNAIRAETAKIRAETDAELARLAAMRVEMEAKTGNSLEEIAHRALIAEIEKATAESLARTAAIKKKARRTGRVF
ncbi:MAG: hypothetical protein LBH53_02545 [Puniceicoccales bacterium]|jgi:hypothetical protein|nr:hypothetical protein [Puniceicoccales bacterium]